jgi:hypothetical protein
VDILCRRSHGVLVVEVHGLRELLAILLLAVVQVGAVALEVAAGVEGEIPIGKISGAAQSMG